MFRARESAAISGKRAGDDHEIVRKKIDFLPKIQPS